MATDIKAPVFPESVAEGTVATWHKKPGESCARDELIVDIETDKVVLEVVAPADGVVSKVLKDEGDTVESGEVIGHFEEGASGDSGSSDDSKSDSKKEEKSQPSSSSSEDEEDESASGDAILSPAARKLANEHGIKPDAIEGTGKGGRVTKEDVQKHIDDGKGGSARKGKEKQ